MVCLAVFVFEPVILCLEMGIHDYSQCHEESYFVLSLETMCGHENWPADLEMIADCILAGYHSVKDNEWFLG